LTTGAINFFYSNINIFLIKTFAQKNPIFKMGFFYLIILLAYTLKHITNTTSGQN